MTTPHVFTFPVRRPGFITAAVFSGDSDRLDLELQYIDADGTTRAFVLPCTRNPDDPGDPGAICLPSNKTITNLHETAIIASLRMATMISGAIPGSAEWMTAFVEALDKPNLQTAIGNVKVVSLEQTTDVLLQVSVQKTSGGPIRVIDTDYGELGTYSFMPSTQLRCVAGAIEAQYPSYVHDPMNGSVLTESQKANILAYVSSLEPWI
jgi:hypothetical protein